MGGPTRLPAGRTRIAHACGGARLMRFRRVPLNDVDWAELDRFADRTHAQRLPWLNYLTAIGAGQPLVALLEDKGKTIGRSEEHTSELQSIMRHSYAVFCLKKKN